MSRTNHKHVHANRVLIKSKLKALEDDEVKREFKEAIQAALSRPGSGVRPALLGIGPKRLEHKRQVLGY